MASNSDHSEEVPFWRRKSLSQMTDLEWESLCDGCGRCCLNKLEEDESAAETFYTDVGCRLLDGHSCRCRDYQNRLDLVDDWLQVLCLHAERLDQIAGVPFGRHSLIGRAGLRGRSLRGLPEGQAHGG